MTPKRLGRRSYLKLSAAVVPTGLLAGHVVGGETDHPEVTTKAPTGIDAAGVTLRGLLTDLGDAKRVKAYFEWRHVGDEEWQRTEPIHLTEPGPFELPVDVDLDLDAALEFRAVVVGKTRTTGEVHEVDASGVLDLEGRRVEVDDVVVELLDHVESGSVRKLRFRVTNERDADLEFSWAAKGPVDAGEVAVPAGESVTAWIVVDLDCESVELRWDGERIATIDVESLTA